MLFVFKILSSWPSVCVFPAFCFCLPLHPPSHPCYLKSCFHVQIYCAVGAAQARRPRGCPTEEHWCAQGWPRAFDHFDTSLCCIHCHLDFEMAGRCDFTDSTSATSDETITTTGINATTCNIWNQRSCTTSLRSHKGFPSYGLIIPARLFQRPQRSTNIMRQGRSMNVLCMRQGNFFVFFGGTLFFLFKKRELDRQTNKSSFVCLSLKEYSEARQSLLVFEGL